MRPIRYKGTNTDFNPSASVFSKCPIRGIKDGSIPGVWFEENFMSGFKTVPTTEGDMAFQNGWNVFSSTGGTIARPAISSSIAQSGITIGSDDDNEGVGLRAGGAPFQINRTGYDLWFEARVSLSTVANTTFEFFIGLLEAVALTAVIPITATAATLSDHNMVGFYRTESDGDAINTTYKADTVTAVTIGTGEIVPAASTALKLGMRFIKRGHKDGNNRFVFYKDGAELDSTKEIPSAAGTDFPNDVGLAPVIAIRNAAGSSPGTATINWLKCYQLKAPADS